MGHYASAKLVLGIAVRRNEIWNVTGHKRVCRHGHEGEAGWEHCPKCGDELENKDIKELTSWMEALAEYLDIDPLRHDDEAGVLGIHECAETWYGWMPHDPDEPEGTSVLGYQVQDASTFDEAAPGRFAAVDLDALGPMARKIEGAAVILLGTITNRPVRLFLSVHQG